MPLSRAVADSSLALSRSRGRGGWGPEQRGAALSIGLGAAILAASVHEPRVLTIRLAEERGDDEAVEALPSGPLEAEHRTLEIGLRTWVERQTSQRLGYVEQLYTFGDRDRVSGGESPSLPALGVAYLSLVRGPRTAGSADAAWQGRAPQFPREGLRRR